MSRGEGMRAKGEWECGAAMFNISYLYGKVPSSQEKCHEDGFLFCSIKAFKQLE
jgi:hypothetical protein